MAPTGSSNAGVHQIGRSVRGLLSVCLLLSSSACAPTQRVPLEVSPETVSIYLDGELLDGTPQELELRSDRDHKLFFKSRGHRSELIVLRSLEDEGGVRLEPAGIALRLAPLDPTRRELSISGAADAQVQIQPDREERVSE